ncbi:ABC transporter permease [Bacillus sp. FJAT-18017]|uniref:ABC transporter permease n=1 Tax=Bacillus sp. FJAT-18017 TaxID=1705566 RepID=UPI0006AEF23B|nr:ABC transporter permease [Bacillus sp. FJAT-18017]ALC91942.1 ABC transporter permease [Bacillus sp. FJAT-18017]
MFDGNKLWKERAGQRMKDMSRYLKYIFNGHLVIVLLFLIGTAAFYYQEWLKTLDTGFPSEWIMAVVFGFILTLSPVYNFLKEPDKIFLIPVEEKLRGYFFRSAIVSGVIQAYVILLLLAIFMPLLAKTGDVGFGMFLPILAILLAAKAWNIAAEWKASFLGENTKLPIERIVRFFVNTAFAYLLFSWDGWLFLLPVAGLMLAYLGYFVSASRQRGLKWETLIAGEEKRMNAFYRLANMFTDVPAIKESVKRRRWLDFLLARIKYSQENAQLYLLSRTYLRSGDYLGLSVRLTVIGILGIWFITYGPAQIFLALLFLYLTGFQLMPLASHYQNNFLVELYPFPKTILTSAFQHLLGLVLGVQTAFFVIALFVSGNYFVGLAAAVSGAVFTYAFVRFYSARRLKK